MLNTSFLDEVSLLERKKKLKKCSTGWRMCLYVEGVDCRMSKFFVLISSGFLAFDWVSTHSSFFILTKKGAPVHQYIGRINL